jgi:hypothetical protein
MESVMVKGLVRESVDWVVVVIVGSWKPRGFAAGVVLGSSLGSVVEGEVIAGDRERQVGGCSRSCMEEEEATVSVEVDSWHFRAIIMVKTDIIVIK